MSNWNSGASVSTSSFTINYDGTNVIVYSVRPGVNYWDAGNGFYIAGAASKNTWHHVALTSDGSTSKLFIDGVLAGTGAYPLGGANSATINIGVNTYYGSGYTTGYISNLRIVAGSQVYSSAFTPSTTPLTAITNTQLLTCQANRFIDANTQTSAKTLTVGGSPSVQRFSPFNPTSAYSTATIGGSGYFDGSGDYLTAPSGSAFAFGTGDLTVEAWIYPTTSVSNYQTIFTTRGTPANAVWFGFDTNTAYPMLYTSTAVLTSSIAATRNAWNHVALVRSGSIVTIYVNGVSGGSVSNSTDFTANGCTVGYDSLSANYPWYGYISNLRVVKGTAVYTTTFTPPSSPLTAIANTSLLLNMTNAGIPDSSMMNDLETVGNAQVSTSVKKYGTGSMYFDGTGDWLVGANSNTGNFGAGDFTVEFWLKTATNGGGACVVSQATGGGAGATSWGLFLGYTSSTSIDVYLSNGSSYFANTGGGNVTDNAWHHIAFSRNGSSGKLFLDGVQVGSTLSLSTTALGNGTLPIYVASQGGSLPITGYIDDLRITKGYARYTANFTPPTAAFPTY